MRVWTGFLIADVIVSLEHRVVAVALKDGQDISDENLKRALTDAGCTVKTIERTDTPIADVRPGANNTFVA